MSDDENKNDVKSVNVKLTPFWEKSPELWFVQAEVQFNVHKIVSETTKYWLAVAALPPDACESIYDILTNPPAQNKYTALKNALVSRHALSQERRLEKLLERTDLGDRKPSELLLEMKRFAGDAVPEAMCKNLWLRKLPKQISVALVIVEDKTLDETAILADRIFEAGRTSGINEVAYNKNSPNEFEKRMDRIESMLQELRVKSSGNPNKSKQGQRSRSKSRERSQKRSWCWYHRKYKVKATKCTQPCNFQIRSSSPN